MKVCGQVSNSLNLILNVLNKHVLFPQIKVMLMKLKQEQLHLWSAKWVSRKKPWMACVMKSVENKFKLDMQGFASK